MIKLLEGESIKIPIKLEDHTPPEAIYGVDIGYTLTKFAYREEDFLILSSIQTSLVKQKFVNNLIEKLTEGTSIHLTGGGAFKIYNTLQKHGNVQLIKEFEANAKGAHFMMANRYKGWLSSPIIACLGTGTSIIYSNDEIRHLGGTALGGGFFMGLIDKLFNLRDYHDILKLAKSGNRYNIDLKVADIYDKEDPRVDSLFREFTAASFSNIKPNAQKQDLIHSILCMLGENIGTIVCLYAEKEHAENIIFCGGFLKDNRILGRILMSICGFHKKKGHFIRNPEFMGAVGALY